MKSHVGRKRYVVFRVQSPPPDRARLTQALRERGCELTVYEQGIGIARVAHTSAADARAGLGALGLETVTTSGTMRAARERAGLGKAVRRR